MSQLLAVHFVFSLFIYCVNCERLELSCEQIRAFVDGHNLRRHQVAQGIVPGQPPASNMMYMVWDEELAEKAARWAENGVFDHNPDRTIDSERWQLIGENIYQATHYSNVDTNVIPNVGQALDAWFNERLNYGFEPYVLGTTKPIGHYTQMVWANSSRMGCGIAQRKFNGWTITLFVCDYGPTGNFIGQIPYETKAFRGYLRCIKGTCDRPYGKFC